MSPFKNLVISVCLLLLGPVIWPQNESGPTVKKEQIVTILFVGNSLTYTNNLPGLVKKRAKKLLGIKLRTDMIALPDYALSDHLAEGNIQKKINSGNYDFVIVQQGPSSRESGKRMLFESMEILTGICDRNGSRLCLFMVWPSLSDYANFDKVIQNHQMVSKTTGAILCPVGKVWKDHIDQSHDYGYYADDGFHPSLKGSLIAADVIVESLFK